MEGNRKGGSNGSRGSPPYPVGSSVGAVVGEAVGVCVGSLVGSCVGGDVGTYSAAARNVAIIRRKRPPN
jgi:hypothetical protein